MLFFTHFLPPASVALVRLSQNRDQMPPTSSAPLRLAHTHKRSRRSIPCGCPGWGRARPPYSGTTPASQHFYTLVCRIQPARAIGSKTDARKMRVRERQSPRSSFPRRYVPYPPMVGGNPEGRGWARQVSTKSPPSTDPILIRWCAGACRHERLVRK